MISVERNVTLACTAVALCFCRGLRCGKRWKIPRQSHTRTRDKGLLKIGNAHEIYRSLIPAVDAVGLSTIKITVQFCIGLRIHTLPIWLNSKKGILT